MKKTVIYVESYTKAQKIGDMLGDDYIVRHTNGIFRDLNPKKMSINFDNHFEPIYIITKPDIVHTLREALQFANMVYLATDPDIEGQGMAQALVDVLKPKKYKRMTFNEITESAIRHAMKNAGDIDKYQVDAQKTRRVIDRLFGYMISPLIQKQIKKGLSAGRTQSPTTRLVIDRENEIKKFIENNTDNTYFKVRGLFNEQIKTSLYEASENEPYEENDNNPHTGNVASINLISGNDSDINVKNFLKECTKSDFTVRSVVDKLLTRSPSPPFTTATLQQEANRKLGMSIDVTMKVAQKLYELGYITYIRTDSVTISEDGHKEIKKTIEKLYGKKYYNKHDYPNTSSSAQLAHECCRVTHPELITIKNEVNDKFQIKLYRLIWQRTIASQMKPAKINETSIQIDISKYINKKLDPFYYFQGKIEHIVFAGFMKVYIESTDDPIIDNDDLNKNFQGKLPKSGSKVTMTEIIARQEFPRPPPRYTQASLVKKLESLGIGRPATYVSTIKTILDRTYIKIDDIPGVKKIAKIYSIERTNSKILENSDEIYVGKENKKIIPTKLGIRVNDYLVQNFPEMIDYGFTAKMESNMDEVANGKKIWYKVVEKFYNELKPIVDKISSDIVEMKSIQKSLGMDPEGNEIIATKFNLKKKIGDKFIFAKYQEPWNYDNITLEAAIKLLAYPKIIGQYKKSDILLMKGPYGYYINYDKRNYPFKDIEPDDLTFNDAIKIINDHKSKIITTYETIYYGKKVKANVLNGPYGHYIQIITGKQKHNFPIPKNLDPTKLTDDQVKEIISKRKKVYKKGGGTYGSKTFKKTTYTKNK